MSFTDNFKLKELFYNVYDMEDAIYKYKPFDTEYTTEDIQTIYMLIMNMYCNSTVKYDTPTAFYRHFTLTFCNYVDEFLAKYKLIQKLKGLTLEDLKVEMSNITNVANNNNRIVDDPLNEIINFITTQSSSVSKTNDILAINKSLTLYTDNLIFDFLNKFSYLFVDIFPTRCYYYNRGDL